ncbi:MAG TPA: host attachment protein [Casimicrobiaceae bacterium]|nr:host attachment protein [Casimicrobiaceae bacterium]
MGKTWMLVANRSRARLLEVQLGSDTPSEIADFANPEGRAHGRDLRTDEDGRFFGKGEHSQGHAATREPGLAGHEVERFADQLRDYLDRARGEQRFGQLWIAAAPAFLGLLRDKLSRGVRAAVEFEIDKDVSTEAPRDIYRLLREARDARARS